MIGSSDGTDCQEMKIVSTTSAGNACIPDSRHIRSGLEIPTENYSDQPYIVKTDDGAWLCIMTTGAGHEGQAGQHVVSLRSTDLGQTWESPVALEPVDGPEASYAVLLKVPSGRVYAFYNHNTDNIRQVKADNPPFKDGYCRRVDSLGHFVFKYTDDHGKTWSKERYDVPMREMAIDRENVYGGDIRFFWNVGKPFICGNAGFVSVHKVGGFGNGFFTRSEGVLVRSEGLLTEKDGARITWETLPEGDAGLRTPPGGGTIAEEQSYSVLSDGSFYCVYRTIDGHPACCYSRDQGRTWTEPRYKAYADGRLMKHPRAANFAWRLTNGKYLYWFHNHGGNWYEDRNPVWLSGGVEVDTAEGKEIRWSQPEIILYDDDPFVRMSYPDLVEDDGRVFLTETQKDLARIHDIDLGLLEALWEQGTTREVTAEGLLLAEAVAESPCELPMPKLPELVTRDSKRADFGTKDVRAGFTVECWITLNDVVGGEVVLDNRDESGHGLSLEVTGKGTLRLILNDGRTENAWECDPEILEVGQCHHVGVVVDGGPKVVSFVIDGMFCDGGTHRQFGWGRFSRDLRDCNGSDVLRVGPELSGAVHHVRLYAKALRTSQLIGNFRAGL